MHLRRAMAVCVTTVMVTAVGGAVSWADETAPTRGEVAAAESAAADKARDVAGVQAELALANSSLENSAIAAAQAAEAYNGALWQLEGARAAATQARESADTAATDVDRQQREYGSALVRSYQSSPEIAGVAAVLDADGVETFVEQRVTLDNAMNAMEGRYNQFRASSTVSELSASRADDAQRRARTLEERARGSRDAAASAAAFALAQSEEIAERKSDLISELAQLEGISVALAGRRQAALEERAAEEADRARSEEQQEQDQEEPEPTPEPAPRPDQTPGPSPEPAPAPRPDPTRTPKPAPAPAPVPSPQPAPTPAPSPARGASAAVGFAAAQLGEPYVWGAAGPNAWDCSGITMKAWAAGGKSLPHWSVGQYQATTPIKASQLRAGDLVFWSSSSNSSTIFHVALYAGDGMIIHAPRTGRPVVKESMYYWRAPNFFTRP